MADSATTDLPVPKLRSLLQGGLEDGGEPSGFGGIANRIGDAISQALQAAFQGLQEAFGGIADGVNDAGEEAEVDSGRDKPQEGPQEGAQSPAMGTHPAEDQQQSAAGDGTDHVDDLEDAGGEACGGPESRLASFPGSRFIAEQARY